MGTTCFGAAAGQPATGVRDEIEAYWWMSRGGHVEVTFSAFRSNLHDSNLEPAFHAPRRCGWPDRCEAAASRKGRS
jgi:hypothetical protein